MKFMSDKVFFDSNILIYSIDESEAEKRSMTKNLIEDAAKNKTAWISTQSLQEFYNVVTRKLKVSKEDAKLMVKTLSETFPVLQVTPKIILLGIDVSVKTGFSFWDSLVLASAVECSCDVLYSEDLNSGQVVNGVKILNPFKVE